MSKLLAINTAEPGEICQRHTIYRIRDHAHFGHAWITPESYGQHGNKWTFNRGTVCLMAKWAPKEYYHASLADLMTHLEKTCPALD